MPAPVYPWKKGKNPDYSCFVLEVEVAIDAQGVMWSSHRLQGAEDVEVAEDLPNQGLEQAADALMSESIKKEAIIEVILKMSNDPEFGSKLKSEDPTVVETLVEEISAAMAAVFTKAVRAVAPESARRALEMVRNDLRPND